MIMNGIQLYRYTCRASLLLILAIFGLTGCGGNSSEPPIIDPPPAIDTTPEAFSFEPSTDQPLNTIISSNIITISGINTTSPISISGGEYSIDDGDFSSLPSTVTEQQTVLVRLLSSTSHSTASNLTITIGDISEVFSVTTHSPLTKFAHELSTDLAAKYSIVSQPLRGRVIVSSDLTKLTFQPMNSFDYLLAGETAQEDIKVTLIGEDELMHDVIFTIKAQNKTKICDGRAVLDIAPSEVNQPLTHIPDGKCVRIYASQLNGGDTWAIWTGENGGARPSMLSVIGVDATDPTLIFLPPTRGRYNLSWCPTSGECLASFYFYSDAPSTKKDLDVKLNIHNFHPEDEILISVTENNHADTSGYSYRWIIHDWTGEYHKLIDVVTSVSRLRIPAPVEHNNYEIQVVVDDNVIQLEGGFNSSTSDLYGKRRLDANTLGNYKMLSDLVVIRDQNSNKKPPTLVVMIDGDTTRYQGNDDVSYPIDLMVGSQLTFDMSETSDENTDVVGFYINGVLHESPSKRFTFDVTSDAYYYICASDGFPWTADENPCLLFDLLIK